MLPNAEQKTKTRTEEKAQRGGPKFGSYTRRGHIECRREQRILPRRRRRAETRRPRPPPSHQRLLLALRHLGGRRVVIPLARLRRRGALALAPGKQPPRQHGHRLPLLPGVLLLRGASGP